MFHFLVSIDIRWSDLRRSEAHWWTTLCRGVANYYTGVVQPDWYGFFTLKLLILVDINKYILIDLFFSFFYFIKEIIEFNLSYWSRKSRVQSSVRQEFITLKVNGLLYNRNYLHINTIQTKGILPYYYFFCINFVSFIGFVIDSSIGFFLFFPFFHSIA